MVSVELFTLFSLSFSLARREGRRLKCGPAGRPRATELKSCRSVLHVVPNNLLHLMKLVQLIFKNKKHKIIFEKVHFSR